MASNLLRRKFSKSAEMVYDVCVIGGGVMGAATTEALARRGRKVIMIEQFTPGHAKGSSYGDGRIFRFANPERFYTAFAKKAYDGWAALQERSEEKLYYKTGGIDIGPKGTRELQKIEDTFNACNIPFERMSAEEVGYRFPQIHLPSTDEALYQPSSGAIDATAAVLAMWSQAKANGATTLEGHRVAGMDVSPATTREGARQVTIRLQDGSRVVCGAAVVAAGSWSGSLCRDLLDLDLPLKMTREVVPYFPINTSSSHRVPSHGPSAMPMFVIHRNNGFSDKGYFGMPQLRHEGMKLMAHHCGEQVDVGPGSGSAPGGGAGGTGTGAEEVVGVGAGTGTGAAGAGTGAGTVAGTGAAGTGTGGGGVFASSSATSNPGAAAAAAAAEAKDSSSDSGSFSCRIDDSPASAVAAEAAAAAAAARAKQATEQRTEEVLRSCSRTVKRYFPHVGSTPLKVYRCLYTTTPDHRFVVDTHPSHPNVVLMTGFSGHGFKFAPVLGEIAADMCDASFVSDRVDDDGASPSSNLDLFYDPLQNFSLKRFGLK